MPSTFDDFYALIKIAADFAIRLFDHENGIESVTRRTHFGAAASALFGLAISLPMALLAMLGFVVPGAGTTLVVIYLFALITPPFVLASRTPPQWRSATAAAILLAVVGAAATAALTYIVAGSTFSLAVTISVVTASVVFCATFSHHLTRRAPQR